MFSFQKENIRSLLNTSSTFFWFNPLHIKSLWPQATSPSGLDRGCSSVLECLSSIHKDTSFCPQYHSENPLPRKGFVVRLMHRGIFMPLVSSSLKFCCLLWYPPTEEVERKLAVNWHRNPESPWLGFRQQPPNTTRFRRAWCLRSGWPLEGAKTHFSQTFARNLTGGSTSL